MRKPATVKVAGHCPNDNAKTRSTSVQELQKLNDIGHYVSVQRWHRSGLAFGLDAFEQQVLTVIAEDTGEKLLCMSLFKP